jgi:hypothetical protein
MADGTLQILGLGTSAAPLRYDVTGSQALDLVAVKADFDGAAAAVDFVPMVQIFSDAGHLMAQAKGPTVTAGGSATVTFAPFLKSESAGGGTDPNAVHYDVANETGGFIDSSTTTNSISFYDKSGTGVYLTSDVGGAATGGFIGLQTGDGSTEIQSTDIVNRLKPTGGAFHVQNTAGGELLLIDEVGAVLIALTAGQQFRVLNLPIVNPGGTGRLWNNGGVVNIT